IFLSGGTVLPKKTSPLVVTAQEKLPAASAATNNNESMVFQFLIRIWELHLPLGGWGVIDWLWANHSFSSEVGDNARHIEAARRDSQHNMRGWLNLPCKKSIDKKTFQN